MFSPAVFEFVRDVARDIAKDVVIGLAMSTATWLGSRALKQHGFPQIAAAIVKKTGRLCFNT
jgi:hypothetical protein